jgi:hypothetical protein
MGSTPLCAVKELFASIPQALTEFYELKFFFYPGPPECLECHEVVFRLCSFSSWPCSDRLGTEEKHWEIASSVIN